MNNLFAAIGRRIERSPFKVLMASVLAVILLLSGARMIRMATGNETLVERNQEVFQSNERMEETFGGDSILLLFTGEEQELLSLDTMNRMYRLEKRFEFDEEIRSVLSPAAVLHEMTVKGSGEMMKNLSSMGEGLEKMGGKMTEVGTTLQEKELMDPEVMKAKLDELSAVSDTFARLIDGQENLSQGVVGLQGGLTEVSGGLQQLSVKLVELSSLSTENPQVKMGLLGASESLKNSAEGLSQMAVKSTNLQHGADQTATGLTQMEAKLSRELNTIEGSLSGGMDPKEVKEMAEGFLQMGDSLQTISEGLLLFHEKSAMMEPILPASPEDLENMLYDENRQMRQVFSEVLPDGNHALMVLKLQGNMKDQDKDRLVEKVKDAVRQEEFSNLTVTVSGKPVLDMALRSEMKTNMAKMVGMAVVIMLVVLALIFKVEWRILSLGIILISVLGTLGLMGYLSVPVTMVSMAVFPILIGLGIDYSIQFHNRFEEEGSVESTLKQIGKAVLIAVAATVLGFASLYISPVPMIKDFGKMLTLGVGISFLGSIFLLLPILTIRNRNRSLQKVSPSPKGDQRKKSGLDRVLGGVTRLVLKGAVPILLTASILAGFGYYLDGQIGVESNIESFMPQEMEALKDIRTLRETLGSTDQIALYMVSEDWMTEEGIRYIRAQSEGLKQRYPEEIVSVGSLEMVLSNFSAVEKMSTGEFRHQVDLLPQSQKAMFLSEDQTESLLLLNIRSMGTESLQQLTESLRQDFQDAPFEVYVTGKSAIDVEMVKGLTSGRMEMTLLGLGLVFLALLFIYRNFFKALVPMVPVLIIIGISSGLMYYLQIDYTPITATIGALVLGMGVEMTVMLMERYLEERKSGRPKVEAMIEASQSIGKAIVASGLTTVGGFSVLMLSEFLILKDFGVMTVINISLALLSTLLVLPPLLVVTDRFLFSRKERSTFPK